MLLLEGEQGIGKSSALRILFGEWLSDSVLRIGDKESYGSLRGVWCHELAELAEVARHAHQRRRPEKASQRPNPLTLSCHPRCVFDETIAPGTSRWSVS